MYPIALTIQIVDNKDKKRLSEQANDLQEFVRLLGLDLQLIDDDGDVFRLFLPDDDFETCQIINAVYAFCILHRHLVDAESEPLWNYK